jgi:enamine deaminase RidA (YjgF/YER057c/UK114 family)
VFVSGQTPRDRDRRIVSGSFRQQADQTFANLNALARAAGATPANALRLTVYLRDIDDFAEMDAAFAAAFPEPRPARTTVQSNLAVAIEVDGVFGIDSGER